ncbi:MAG: dynamin family protein, partial [Succinivibrionaceae bacterium]|nr:dynamin family protein [Succinivibrionaceae bacterium]
TVRDWLGYFGNLMDQERIRQDLSHSFIVFVYGKVKAGKSSLGNFIASCAKSDPLGLCATFRVYDSAGSRQVDELSEIDDDSPGFAEKITECTKEIQMFTLGGMTWVDTPGLSSLTKENEDLARKYIDAADFVIFPSSSDSPLQKTEIDQINELTGKFQRKITFVITKSDTTDVDEVDGKVVEVMVNKSPEARAEQLEDVNRRLSQELRHPEAVIGEIMAISVATAREALRSGDRALFEGSNIAPFCEMLRQSVLSKAEQLKKSAPFASLSALIDAILAGRGRQQGEYGEPVAQGNGLDRIVSDLGKLSSYTRELRGNYDLARRNILGAVGTIVSEATESCCVGINPDNCKALFQKAAREIDARIGEMVQREIKGVVEKFRADYGSVAAAGKQPDYSIEKRFEDATVTTHYVKSGSVIGGLLGGVIGFFSPVPGGAALGASLGASLGGVAGSHIDDVEYVPVEVGDNAVEVVGNFIRDNTERKRLSLGDLLDANERELIDPLERMHREFEDSVKGLRSFLEERQRRYQATRG